MNGQAEIQLLTTAYHHVDDICIVCLEKSELWNSHFNIGTITAIWSYPSLTACAADFHLASWIYGASYVAVHCFEHCGSQWRQATGQGWFFGRWAMRGCGMFIGTSAGTISRYTPCRNWWHSPCHLWVCFSSPPDDNIPDWNVLTLVNLCDCLLLMMPATAWIYIHSQTIACTHAIHPYIDPYMHTAIPLHFIHWYIYIYINIQMYDYMYIYMYYIYYVQRCTYEGIHTKHTNYTTMQTITDIQTNKQTNVHTYIHACIRTYIP